MNNNPTKIKVFRFEVSNASSECFNEDINSDWYRENQAKLSDEKFIEKKINNFIKNKEIIDIKTNIVDVKYHNNARGNTVHLIYTIVYKKMLSDL